MTEPRRFYSRRDVQEEIAEFLRGRWAAVALGDGAWIRWDRDRKPLRIESPGDVERLAQRGARSFYGTIEVFRRLENEYDVTDGYSLNVEGASSFIDIDVLDEDTLGEAWHAAVEAASLIAGWLDERAPGSVYILWSGAGAHVRVCWKPLSREAGRHGVDPVWLAYAAAEHVLRSLSPRLREVVERSGLIKIENIVARNRVFTAPLSLHRRLDMAAVAFRPGEAGLFTLSWANPESPRHDPEAWRSAASGGAERLAREVLEAFSGATPERTVIAPSKPPTPAARRVVRAVKAPAGKIGRFPVMALLQAARYYVLNRDLARAKSFGLNRAIFYAWAKYYGPARSAARRLALEAPRGRSAPGSRRVSEYRLEPVPGMREEAPVGPSGWYVMGGVEQTPEDFDRHVARRFEEAGIPFEEAWRAAVEYVSRFPLHVLRDPRLFYERVYLPVRDRFEVVLRGETPRRAPPPRSREQPRREQATKPRAKTLLDWLSGDEARND